MRIVINEMDFIKTRDEDETANLIWNDSAVQHEKIAELRNYQVHCISTMSGQQTMFGRPQVAGENLTIRMSVPLSALDILTYSNEAKGHDTDHGPADLSLLLSSRNTIICL